MVSIKHHRGGVSALKSESSFVAIALVVERGSALLDWCWGESLWHGGVAQDDAAAHVVVD